MIGIRRLGSQIGAEITGVDVRTLDDAEFDVIYRAWLDYNVVVVRDQELTLPEYVRYSRRFGSLELHPSKSTRHPEAPEVTFLGVNKFDADGKLNMRIYRRGAEGWHTDGSYERVPFKATQLYAVAVPSRGGDTYFASCYASYEALPDGLKQRLQGLQGAYVYGGRRKDGKDLLDPEDRNTPAVLHPLLRTHPETGRAVLYFDPNKLLYIEGLAPEASESLIAELRSYMVQPGADYTHKWRKGDIVIWDNRCSYHKAAGDYPPEEDRIHWRVSIKEAA
jgi:taurine dioxygenase